MHDIKQIIELIQHYWSYSKNKIGFGILLLSILYGWFNLVFPLYSRNDDYFVIYTIIFTICILFVSTVWLVWSCRVLIKSVTFTIVFCLRPKDSKSYKYIDNALTRLNSELDKLGLLDKFKIKIAGSDVINSQKQAVNYRENFDVDLIIWGDVYSGLVDQKGLCDFKNLSFTYKVPKSLIHKNLTEYFKNDINIALVNRDWNIYEVNSIPDTEKVTSNLSEIIMFLLGLIYCQYNEFIEDSIVILERLFWSLENRASGDDVVIDNDKKEITLSPASLRSGRVLAILINIYKNIGIDFTSNNLFDRGYYYLDKYFKYHNDDVLALSSMALCCFMLNDVPSAMSYTEKIGRIDKSSPFYIINKAFFGIYDKNYTSAIYFYKEILKRGMIVDPRIITGVISFLDQRYRNDRKELAYEFAIGILNKYYCQQKEGINELRKFVRKAKNIPQYQEMVIFAINNIQKPKRKRN